ncbi:MAG: hypothetical protein RLZZ591_291 [Pseudomonadota bacterium]|jgi:predicted DNA binding CopG/RHH family protein
MSVETLDPRALLAKMDAEEKAVADAAAKLATDNEKKRKEILAKLRDSDLEDVKAKCKMHGFTASELRGALKVKGAAKKATPRKSPANKTTARAKKQ